MISERVKASARLALVKYREYLREEGLPVAPVASALSDLSQLQHSPLESVYRMLNLQEQHQIYDLILLGFFAEVLALLQAADCRALLPEVLECSLKVLEKAKASKDNAFFFGLRKMELLAVILRLEARAPLRRVLPHYLQLLDT
jgi:hypothetical protein